MENSLIEVLKTLFARDLQKLKQEIELYEKEDQLWVVEKGITNSGGNLCLHLIGNLNTYICAEFGKNGYIRQRDLEFSLKNIPKSELIGMIEQTNNDLQFALDQITLPQLKSAYPTIVFGKATTTEYFLVHLTTHLTYHLGQINYHRRLLNNDERIIL